MHIIISLINVLISKELKNLLGIDIVLDLKMVSSLYFPLCTHMLFGNHDNNESSQKLGQKWTNQRRVEI